MTDSNTRRRTVLKGAAASSVAALAGCLGGGSSNDGQESPAPTQTQQAQDGLDEAKEVDTDRIAADPTDIPDPVDWDEPKHHDIELVTTEETAEIEPGVTFDYMTFGGQVPGPMIRVRRGDTINLTLTNEEGNSKPHNIDFHAVYGPGGGAEDTMVAPGESATIEFRAMYPGVHIYHCAVPNLDQHISAGMFGSILVEPEEGLPEVDRELYFGQHEIYTKGEPGEQGHHAFDYEAMANEEPTYVVANGEAYGFTPDGPYDPINIQQSERVRVFFTNGGPNLTCSWHAIGNNWTKLYRDGDVVSPPARYVETTPVAPGTVTAAEMDTPVPGPIKLVDHALSRVARRGRMAVLNVQGEPNTDVFNPDP
ncbi:copper-containing nitrite reductase [Halovenus marina]|uniref:copper-containing nitrite reductase n=1 Tax=Halovenus marina TaxID=3396621 RepID=UPI003F558E5B